MSPLVHAALDAALLREIVATACLAPSGDNMQPWSFSFDESGISVRRDPARDPSFYNVSGKSDLLAIGAAIENACLRAGELALEARVAYFPDESDPLLVARIELERSDSSPDPLARAIPRRVTNRAPYEPADLAPAAWDRVLALVGPGRSRIVLLGRERVNAELRAPLSVADRLLFRIDGYRADLRRAVRWTRSEAERTRDGLPLATLGLSFMERLGLLTLGSRTLSRVFGSRASVSRGARMLERTGGVVAIGVAAPTSLELVGSGRLFQRLWLACTLEGIAFQPHMGLPLMQARAELGDASLSSADRSQILGAGESVARALGLAPGHRAAAIARVGLAPEPTARTIRRPLESVIA